MEDERARALLQAERLRLERELVNREGEAAEDRDAANERGGAYGDRAEPMTAEETDDAVAEQLRARLAAIGRAEQRLAAGTYGKSVRSGQPIPDERLEADPAAELTVEEAAEA